MLVIFFLVAVTCMPRNWNNVGVAAYSVAHWTQTAVSLLSGINSDVDIVHSE